MKAGTAMDAFKQSYPDDPLAGVRKEIPPKDPDDESEDKPAEDEESEDLADDPNADVDDDPNADVDDEAAVDEEAAAAH